MILIVAGISLRGCENGAPSDAGGRQYREIGLATVPDNSLQPAEDPQETPQDSEAETPSEVTDQPPQETLPSEVPDINSLLQGTAESDADSENSRDSQAPDVLGSGFPLGGIPAGGGLPELIVPRSKPGAGAGGSLTPGPNSTSFMNIVGNGNSFVYVIDTSSSMSNGGRLELAKSQLKSSLRLLQPTQKFQILFYNKTISEMKLRKRAEQDMYQATTVHVMLAEQEIGRVTPFGSTEHLQPILRALRLDPDVVYFLTDGDQPQLSRADLELIRRENRSGASIHVIEFASGARESRELSWLQRLAQQSRGKYSYIPIR